MKVEIVETELIKPSCPTPENLRRFELSLIDQVAPFYSFPFIFFFNATNHDGDHDDTNAQRPLRLKKSLSETLTKFYPFAGRLRGNSHVDCNDAGAEFAVARSGGPICSVLGDDPALRSRLMLLVPVDAPPKESLPEAPLLSVRLTFFTCGGSTISLSISHKVADGVGISNFLASWAAAVAGAKPVTAPELLASRSLFPPHKLFASAMDAYKPLVAADDLRVRRLVFPAEKIALLRSRLAGGPTRVEAIMALIWKCAMEAARKCLSPPPPSSMLVQQVNMRGLAKTSAEKSGTNIVWVFRAAAESCAETEDLAAALREGVDEFRESWETRVQPEEIARFIGECSRLKQAEQYTATSLCRFPFHNADFGWGKPALVCAADLKRNNIIVLVADCDGHGIQAWLSFAAPVMAILETNQDLLHYTSSSTCITS